VIWENTHKLLRRPGFIGGKTGVTVTAGPCLATIFKSKAGENFVVIVLRAAKLSRRFKETRWILGLTLKKFDAKKYASDCQ
jgi:D-alanyl-D-alanine carboxypeptidase